MSTMQEQFGGGTATSLSTNLQSSMYFTTHMMYNITNMVNAISARIRQNNREVLPPH
jgi:hypothetical protein